MAGSPRSGRPTPTPPASSPTVTEILASLDRIEKKLNRIIDTMMGRRGPMKRPKTVPGHRETCTCEECFPTE